MNDFPLLPVVQEPFPHAVADAWLDQDLYRQALETFPECPPGSGPTGFTCLPGDAQFEALMAEAPVWRQLNGMFQSQAFVDYMLIQFAEVFQNECVHDLSQARFIDYIEDRTDKELPAIRHLIHAPNELWVRFDIMQGRIGYDRGPHVDHRRRAATLLIYFSDPDETETIGGDLLMHNAEMHPVRTIRPRHNRIAMFPCNNASWHSVSPIKQQQAPRNFVQVTLSSSVDLWPAPAQKAKAGVRSRLRHLFSGRS